MKIDRRWLWGAGALAAAAALLAAGVPLTTLIILAAVLACPAAMFFGMRGMQHGAGGMASHRGSQEPRADSAAPTGPASETDGRQPAVKS